MGVQSLLLDMGVIVALNVYMDASAGIAIASRKGLGGTKHLQVQYLWVQSLVTAGRVKLFKVPGEINRSDLLTKHLPAARMVKLLAGLHFSFEQGISELALKAN